jgi:hypothetical protein
MGRLATRLGGARVGEQLPDRQRAVTEELQPRLLELLVGQLATRPGRQQLVGPAGIKPLRAHRRDRVGNGLGTGRDDGSFVRCFARRSHNIKSTSQSGSSRGKRGFTCLIDHAATAVNSIQERLDQLLAEADKLREAAAALDPRSSSSAARKPAARKPAPAAAPEPKAAATKRAPAKQTSKPAARTRRRTAPGATKTTVLAALASGDAMTAGQVADKTGLARPTVSTTLSKRSKSGEVQKAERGYRLASSTPATPSSPAE